MHTTLDAPASIAASGLHARMSGKFARAGIIREYIARYPVGAVKLHFIRICEFCKYHRTCARKMSTYLPRVIFFSLTHSDHLENSYLRRASETHIVYLICNRKSSFRSEQTNERFSTLKIAVCRPRMEYTARHVRREYLKVQLTRAR